MLILTRLIAAAALTAATASPVLAESITVQHRDLDLSTAQGKARLDARLAKAARKVCGMNDKPTGSRLPNKEAMTCYRETLGKLELQMAELTKGEARQGG